jgi:hypothetical protein
LDEASLNSQTIKTLEEQIEEVTAKIRKKKAQIKKINLLSVGSKEQFHKLTEEFI